MKPFIFLTLIVATELPCLVQSQRHRVHHSRPRPYPYQSFGDSNGFRGETAPADISSNLASQLTSHPEYQEQPQRGNEVQSGKEATANLPLFKQSYPGLYVKGHAPRNFKYEPTRQVAHHHGPNYHIPRNIASSAASEHDFSGGPHFSGDLFN